MVGRHRVLSRGPAGTPAGGRDQDQRGRGAQPFNDHSQKFRGFAPGFNVFVVGAYAGRGEADRKAADLRRCFPGAYVKFGAYLGE